MYFFRFAVVCVDFEQWAFKIASFKLLNVDSASVSVQETWQKTSQSTCSYCCSHIESYSVQIVAIYIAVSEGSSVEVYQIINQYSG